MDEILVTELIHGQAFDRLRTRFAVTYDPDLFRDARALAAKIEPFRAVIVRNQTQVTADLIHRAPHLLVIGRLGVGLDNIDLGAAAEAGIVVASTPDQNAISVAELAIGMMLSLVRSIPAANQDTKAGHWNRRQFTGAELYGKTLGIVGAGKIGLLTAMRARAFGMRVVAYDPFLSPDNALLSAVEAELVPIDELLGLADVVSCHMPANASTKGFFDSRKFAAMKPSAIFVNTSRGALVREKDLAEALKAGRLAGAALDVRQKEPPVVGDLEGMANVILTPHIAAFTHEAQGRVVNAVCDDVTRVLEGRPALNAVGIARPARVEESGICQPS